MSCICVLGMHRSGTSCLTGIMQGLGVELGEVYTENLHNKRGNRENDRIVELNEAVLQTNQGAWGNPVTVNQWTREQTLERDAILAELSNRGAADWGFKDTRTLFTLPFWLEAIPAPRFIGTFRHPQRVATSLHARDGSTLEYGWELWRRYNLRLLELAREHHFNLVDFDQEDTAYLDSVIASLVALGLDAGRAEQGRQFFDPALRNQAGSDVSSAKLPTNVLDVYAELLQLAA